jgi:hypothetical protein
MHTIEVNEKQKKQIRRVVDTLAEDADVVPQDFVDNWEPKPLVSNREIVGHTTTDVRVDKIVGTTKQNINRLVNKRLFNVLRKIHDGEYTYMPPHDEPPHLEKIDGSFYVSNDGIHRVLAHKILGLDEIYAEVHNDSRRKPASSGAGGSRQPVTQPTFNSRPTPQR